MLRRRRTSNNSAPTKITPTTTPPIVPPTTAPVGNFAFELAADPSGVAASEPVGISELVAVLVCVAVGSVVVFDCPSLAKFSPTRSCWSSFEYRPKLLSRKGTSGEASTTSHCRVWFPSDRPLLYMIRQSSHSSAAELCGGGWESWSIPSRVQLITGADVSDDPRYAHTSIPTPVRVVCKSYQYEEHINTISHH